MAMLVALDTTFTAAVTTRADRAEIQAPGGEGPTGGRDGGANVLLFYVTGDQSSGSAEIEVFITEDVSGTETVVWSQVLTASVKAQRTGMANTSGNYLCTVTNNETNLQTVDLGYHAGGKAPNATKVYVSCRALTTFTSLRVRARWLRSI